MDDNEINLEIARGLLSELNCSVITAEGGHEALKILTARQVDLALIDLEMPEMDGFTLAREIRTLPTGSQLPLVAMSAHVMGETRALAAAAGLNGYLTKPIDCELLQTELLRLLRSPSATNHSSQGSAHQSQRIESMEPFPSSPDLNSDIHVKIDHALNLLGGNKDIFHFMVRRFCETWENVEDQFANAADMESKRRLAHTLKGLCASLGSQDLSDLSAKLETCYREAKEPDPALLDNLFCNVKALSYWLKKNVPLE